MHPIYIEAFLIVLFVSVVGLMFGSFLNVVIHRLPLMIQTQWKQQCNAILDIPESKSHTPALTLWKPRSKCPHCHKAIPIWANIPLVSYLILGGRCHACQCRISLRYPIVELLGLLAALMVFYRFGISFSGLMVFIFSLAAIALAAIDLEHFLLPDNLTIPVLWVGLFINVYNTLTPLHDAVIGAIAGYLCFYILAWLFERVRHIEGMGQGDFKCLAMLGAWVGWQLLPFIIFLASILGIIISMSYILVKRLDFRAQIPFGPYLLLAGWVSMMWGQHILSLHMYYFSITAH